MSLGTKPAVAQETNVQRYAPFELLEVTVNDKTVSPAPRGSLVLPSKVETLYFRFAPNPLASNAPVRFRWQLDGFQTGWQEAGVVSMRIIARYQNDNGEILGEESFEVRGQSPGWTSRLSDSPFLSRRETLTPPEAATRLWLVISSAGPPEAIGVYAVRNLIVSQPSVVTNALSLIPRVTEDDDDLPPGRRPAPSGWIRDGLELRDAWLVSSGEDGQTTLAIVDGHAGGHAAWSALRPMGAPLVAGEPLVLEWEEAYSISRGDYGDPTYHDVPAGLYRFRMAGFTLLGDPTGVETSVSVTVPEALWKTAWFWILATVAGMGFGLAGWRVSEWRRMTRQMKTMERDRAVERERVRIAQDIHDDLGARVTQISLLSSAAEKRPGLTREIQGDLEQVSQLCRSMVAALYETVWTVDPENDSLDELGAYICQMTTQICAQSNLRCRLTVPDLPNDLPLGSKVRHELIMAVKEAIHNAIKHSGASELQLHLQLEGQTLTITVSDNGRGFDPVTHAAGHGLSNMQRRMKSCGGTCSVRSRPGEGTQVRLEMSLEET